MLEQTLNGQVMKNSTILKEYVFQGAPKFWFSYINTFLLRKTKIISIEHSCYTITILKDITKISVLLQNISSRITVPTTEQSFVIKGPIAKIIKFDEHIEDYFSQTWIFRLHRKLHANITSEYIDIYINYLYFCKSGFVEVKSFRIKHLNVWTHIYCGFQSTSMCFPPHRNVEIKLSFERYSSHDILMRYSVTDTQLMVSSLQNKTKYLQYHNKIHKRQQEFVNWRINLPRQRVQFIRLTLQFEKYRYLRIRFPSIQYLVEAFDGPGTLSPKLSSTFLNDDLYEIITSSSQCILNVCIGCLNSIIYLYQLDVNSFYLPEREKIVLNDQNISSFTSDYSNQKTNKKVDIIKILAPNNMQLNVTIHNLFHNFKRNFLSSYGGFVVCDIKKMKYNQKISSKCYSHTDVFRHQSIYSKSSTILYVAYSYREYGSMNLSVRVSTTKCNIVRVNCEPWNVIQNIEECTVFQTH